MSATDLVEDLFRRESARLVAALTRLLGPSHVELAEDVVQDALESAMHAWRFAPPRDPTAWILATAKHRAIDRLRELERHRRLAPALSDSGLETLDTRDDAADQLAMMFSLCAPGLGRETHVTLILRFLCGLSPAEIARAFFVDVQTVDRRLHRGRARLRELGRLTDVRDPEAMRLRQPSVMHALYSLFTHGYQASDGDPMFPAVCAEALRLGELLLESDSTSHPEVHALVAMCCFHAARLPARLDDDGVFLTLAEQDRSRWDRALIERGVLHLGASANGPDLTRWHVEAGIAAEHALAPSLPATNWRRIVALYDELLARAPNPAAALGRVLALAELDGFAAAREAFVAVDTTLARYHYYWAARAELELRAGHPAEGRLHYARAVELARSDAERRAYERKLARIATV
ncbi:MAG: polymerase sigma-70 factor, subfamily [bacterium]|nr:polymerase sigma-70 factor, subfamily [bacterium]